MNCPYVMRRCKECGEIKFLFKFIKNKKSKYGFEKKCKQCQSGYNKEYNKKHKEEKTGYNKKYYETHKEERVEYNQKYREGHKEEIKMWNRKYREENQEKIKEYKERYKEEIKEYNKKYKEECKEKTKVYNKKYKETHKEEIAEYQKQYRKTPLGQMIIFNNNQKRRHKEKNQGDGISKEQWLEMMDFFNWQCAYSNIKLRNNKSIDHIVALNNGGLNEIWNCVPMYKPYNSSKNTSDMLEWYQQQDFYSEERLQKIYEWQEYAYNKWGKENEV